MATLITTRPLHFMRNSHLYAFSRRLVWPQSRSGPSGAEKISLPPSLEVETQVVCYPLYRLINPVFRLHSYLPRIRSVELRGKTNASGGQVRTLKEAVMMAYPCIVTNEKHPSQDGQVTWPKFRRVSLLFWHVNVILSCFFFNRRK